MQVWHIYAVTFLSGAVGIFDSPARTALIPALVRPEQLATAYALNISWRQIATLSGPFIGGVIIASVGLSTSYFIDAVSFLSVIFCLALMRARPAPTSDVKKESPMDSVRSGFAFIRDNTAILGLMGMDTCVQFFGAYRSMMPVFARDILAVGPAGLGALLGVPAFGALAGSAIVLAVGNPKRKGRVNYHRLVDLHRGADLLRPFALADSVVWRLAFSSAWSTPSARPCAIPWSS